MLLIALEGTHLSNRVCHGMVSSVMLSSSVRGSVKPSIGRNCFHFSLISVVFFGRSVQFDYS